MDEQIVARADEYQETALRNTGKGSYRVRLRSEMTTHMDFSDLALLGAHDRAEAERRAGVLEVVSSCTLAFFNQYLTGMNSHLLDEAVTNEFVEAVQRLEPSRFPCPAQ